MLRTTKSAQVHQPQFEFQPWQLQPHLVHRGICSGHRVQTQIQTVQGTVQDTGILPENKIRYRQSKVQFRIQEYFLRTNSDTVQTVQGTLQGKAIEPIQ